MPEEERDKTTPAGHPGGEPAKQPEPGDAAPTQRDRIIGLKNLQKLVGGDDPYTEHPARKG